MSRDGLRALVTATMGVCLVLRVRESGRLEMAVRTWVEREHFFHFLLVHFRLRPEAFNCRWAVYITPARTTGCCRGSWPRRGSLTTRSSVTHLRTRWGRSRGRSGGDVDRRHGPSVCLRVHFVEVYGNPQGNQVLTPYSRSCPVWRL